MHKLFGGSKSPAVDSVLKPVTEDPDEESSKQESSNGHKNSSTGESTGGKGDSSESFQVGKKETQMLRWSKLLVVVVIVVLAISTATLTYFYVKNQERQEYESQVCVFHMIVMPGVMANLSLRYSDSSFSTLSIYQIALYSSATVSECCQGNRGGLAAQGTN